MPRYAPLDTSEYTPAICVYYSTADDKVKLQASPKYNYPRYDVYKGPCEQRGLAKYAFCHKCLMGSGDRRAISLYRPHSVFLERPFCDRNRNRSCISLSLGSCISENLTFIRISLPWAVSDESCDAHTSASSRRRLVTDAEHACDVVPAGHCRRSVYTVNVMRNQSTSVHRKAFCL